jgi:signal transduction histidine kinase/ligand-binding sensor domain-containing protein/CheY-like chemotaxis protein
MKNRFILTILLPFLLSFSARATDIRFRNFSTDDGLPDNSVRAIVQDSHGLIWLCTREGICMYDGLHFKLLEDDSCDILDGLAMNLAEDHQHRLWFVTTHGIGFHDLETGETRTVRRNTQGGLIGAADIAVDRNGLVWFANEDIFCWDPARETLTDYSPAANFRSDAVEADSNGSIWFLSSNGDLYRYNNLGSTFERIHAGGVSSRSSRHDLVSDGEGHLLYSAPGGTVLSTDIFTYVTTTRYRTGEGEIRCIVPEDGDFCWLGTDRGVLLMGPDGSERFTHDNAQPESLAGEDVWSMLRDRQGNLWIGMFYNGLSVARNQRDLVTRHMGRRSGGDLSGDMIRPLLLLDESLLLAGAEDGGLSLLNLSDGSVEDLTFPAPDGGTLNIQGLCAGDGDIWVATFNSGAFRLDATTHKVRRNYLSDLSAASILRTRAGEVYLGTTSGMYRYDRAEDRFQSCPEFGSAFIHALYEDSRGNLWVGTYGDGVWTGKDGHFKHIKVADEAYGLTSEYITCIREDSRHRVWVLTEAGGACYAGLDEIASGTFRFRNISRRNGLTSNITCSILEDLDQVLWLTTTHGIVKLAPEDLSIREIYNEEQGGMLNQYSYGSACAASGGRLFFGTSRGLIGFTPSDRNIRRPQRLYITDILTNGPDGISHVTEPGKSAIRSGKIRLRYTDVSVLTIRYASPDFQSSRTGLLRTTLEGNRKSIQNFTYSGESTYTDLPPGKYQFTVSGVGARSQLTRPLEIEIIPPFYRSVWAYILYALAALALLWFLLRQFEHFRHMRMTREVEKLQAEQQKELYDAKINFFTNITHEIRTPLSLIKMPLDKIISSGNYTESNRQELLTMKANTDRLLNLTNQLLDLRKMEKMEIRPTFLVNDIPDLIRRVCDRFSVVAKDQHLTIDQDLPDGPFQAECAGEMVEKIVSNLLSNACKYGDSHIRVALEPQPETDTFRIRVDSDGDRIPEEDTERIFEEFYQAGPARQSKGTGLGLPYARNLAALHGGTLTLDRSVKDWNSFVLELPVHQEERVELPPALPAEKAEEPAPAFDNQLHTILVVEDDPDMRGYLAKALSEQYNVLVAANGEDALKLVENQRVDLIVSDIMMPGIDGVALCNRIKSTTEYCHIPVILLTAAVGMETRIETLEAGADGYIEKPFAIELLLANVENLFKNREIANRQFTQSPLTHFNSMVTGGMDKEFMDRLHDIVMKHLAEPDLNIETLTNELGTSKSTLYRKVTANTGLNINEYIRVSRLKKAAEMLSSQKYRISEVAYMTGFSSPSYFATCFQKQFNVSPSSFLKGLKG